ncbi:MAG: hypothetical protein KIT87_19365 [Anaerolineae bacterium]|nr:hypothetical protein [Anaerolineae bacterium]
MTLQVLGTIDGKRIELERETGLPPGAQVLVVIHPRPLSLTEKRHLVDVLCGSWAGDSSLEPIFAEIEQQRAISDSREVDFSVSS